MCQGRRACGLHFATVSIQSVLPALMGGRHDVFNQIGSKRHPIGISAKSKAKINIVCVQSRQILSSSAAANLVEGTGPTGSHPHNCCLCLEKLKKKKRGKKKEIKFCRQPFVSDLC